MEANATAEAAIATMDWRFMTDLVKELVYVVDTVRVRELFPNAHDVGNWKVSETALSAKPQQ